MAANQLAATILAPDAAPIPPVHPAFSLTDTVGSRARLQGSIARAAGPTYFLIPDVVSTYTSRSRQISVSDDGDPASASDRSETAFQALNIDNVIYGILRTVGGSGELPMTVGGTPSGPAVSFSPIVGSPFDSLSVTIGVGAPQTISIAQAVGLIGGSWIPWAGMPGAPPAIPAQVGIPTLIAADATPIDAASFLGPVGSPESAMRSTSLGIALSGTGIPTTCAHTATLVAGIIGANIARPLSVALASIQPPANPADGLILSAARLAAPPFFAALSAAIDAISAHHGAIITLNSNLAAHGVTIGLGEAGRHIGQQLQAAELKAAANVIALVAPSPDPAIATAINAALAARLLAPDPFQSEARRLLGSAALSLSKDQMDAAVASVSATLRISGFVPPPPHLPPPLLPHAPHLIGGFGPHLGFATAPPPSILPPAPRIFEGLVVSGSELLSAAEVIHAIADSFGKPDGDLTSAISLAAGKPVPDAFFAADAAGLAAQAAEDWAFILAAARSTAHADCSWLVPPTSWLIAGRRLRHTADVAREARAVAPRSASTSAAPRDDADRSVVKSASGTKARATSASGATIGCLTFAPVVAAEAAAIKLADALGEARRIREASYGGPALTYLLSDGTAAGTMPNKGTPSAPLPPSIPSLPLSLPPTQRSAVGRN